MLFLHPSPSERHRVLALGWQLAGISNVDLWPCSVEIVEGAYCSLLYSLSRFMDSAGEAKVRDEGNGKLVELTRVLLGHKMLATWLPVLQDFRAGRDGWHFSLL
jgi:hypothetical protein